MGIMSPFILEAKGLNPHINNSVDSFKLWICMF